MESQETQVIRMAARAKTRMKWEREVSCHTIIQSKTAFGHLKGNSGFRTSWPQMKEHEISKRTSHH